MYINPKFIQKMPPNVDGRDFIVGDLHGCFDELARLMTYVSFDPKKDRLFSTGDLVDRGPRSEDCLTLLNKKWFFPVLGNHEDILLTKFKMMEAGQHQVLSKEEEYIVKKGGDYLGKIFNMPLVYEIESLIHGNIYVLHAEILPEHLLNISNDNNTKEYGRYFSSMKKFNFTQQILQFFEDNRYSNLDYYLKQKLIWSRKFATAFYKDHQKDIDNGDFSFLEIEGIQQDLKIFCGHNVVPFPMKIGQQYYLDTGAALGYSTKELNSYLFTQFGHEFFTLSMIEVSTGLSYGCVTSPNNRGKIFKLDKSIYE